MIREANNWFYESAASRKSAEYIDPASSFAPLKVDGEETFEQKFERLAESYRNNPDINIDIKRDNMAMINDKHFMETYKNDLLLPVCDAFLEAFPNDPHAESVVENVKRYWDTKVKSYTESAAVTAFLPISTLEFPVLVKQFFSSPLKDIIEVETIKTPTITKHIRTTYMVDNQTGDEYEYPKCMFDGTWEKLYDASRGHKIKNDIVPFTDGRLWKYDIIGGLTDGTAGVDELSLNFKITAIQVGTERIELLGNGITVELSTNGTLKNGDLNFLAPSGTQVDDVISGQVDFKNGTISCSSASGQVTGVAFEGYLSNTKNMRTISVREKRSLIDFKVEDGPRWNMPFTIEEIEDASAMLDMNYYNRMVDEITKTQEMQECMTVIKFLLDEQKKFNGIETDTFKLESLAMTFRSDIKPPVGFAGDPFKYVASKIQFRLKGIIHQMSELTKMDDLSFVLVGNPMVTQLLSEFTQWKATQGTSIGGITVNGSYGFATDMGANVRVVGSNLYDPYTVDAVEKTGKRELILHGYVYFTSPDHSSFRHLKYTNHLMTSQSQTAYGSPQAPAGAYNIVTATSRYKTISIQGVQFDLILENSDYVYDEAPARPPVMGAPWA